MAAEPDRESAFCLLVRHVRHMSTHRAGWIDERGPQLDENSFDSICIIRGPDLWEKLEHTWIEAPTTRGASFPQDVGESSGERIKDVGESQYVRMVCRRRWRLKKASVVVPLNVGDVGAVEDVGDRLDNEFLHFREPHVQYQLVAFLSPWIGTCVERPFGMFMVQVRVRVYL